MSPAYENDAVDFWAHRRCFLPPTTPELDEAADLLDRASDAILAADTLLAGDLVAQADKPVIRTYSQRITGPTSREVHRYCEVPDSPPTVPARETRRMPSRSVEREVFERDGWRCRVCGIRVIAKGALVRLSDELPEVARWRGLRDAERHAAFLALCSSLDHILPHSRRGTNDRVNLVTACGPCQFGRNQWTLEEVGFSGPRERPPVVDDWDGLTRLCS